MPQITIVIPTYNRDQFLKEAIASALRETDLDIEVLVVDNASTNDMKIIVDGFKDSRLKFFRNKENLGMTGNWNRCLELASGEYFLLLSDDDRLLPGGLKSMYEALVQYPSAGFAVGGVLIIDSTGKVSEEQLPNGIEDKLEDGFTFYSRYMRGKIPVQCCAILIRKKILDVLGSFDTTMPHSTDKDMWSRAALLADVVTIGRSVAEYRRHVGCLSNEHKLQGITGLSFSRLMKKHEALTKSLNRWPDSELSKLFYDSRLHHFGGTIAVALDCFKGGNIQAARTNFNVAAMLAPTIKERSYARLLCFATYFGRNSYGVFSYVKRQFVKK